MMTNLDYYYEQDRTFKDAWDKYRRYKWNVVFGHIPTFDEWLDMEHREPKKEVQE